MTIFKYATIIHPGFSQPKVFCTDTNICQYILERLMNEYGKKPEVVRNDKLGNMLGFEINCGEKWFESSAWILQYFLDQGWEPIGVTSKDGHSSHIHLRFHVDDGNKN